MAQSRGVMGFLVNTLGRTHTGCEVRGGEHDKLRGGTSLFWWHRQYCVRPGAAEPDGEPAEGKGGVSAGRDRETTCY